MRGRGIRLVAAVVELRGSIGGVWDVLAVSDGEGEVEGNNRVQQYALYNATMSVNAEQSE